MLSWTCNFFIIQADYWLLWNASQIWQFPKCRTITYRVYTNLLSFIPATTERSASRVRYWPCRRRTWYSWTELRCRACRSGEPGYVYGGQVVWQGELLNTMLFLLVYSFNQCRNSVKENGKDDKDQKERFYCCEHWMWHKSSNIYSWAHCSGLLSKDVINDQLSLLCRYSSMAAFRIIISAKITPIPSRIALIYSWTHQKKRGVGSHPIRK